MKKQNLFARQDEYMALRSYIRCVEAGENGDLTDSVRRALSSELTPRQKQLVYMYYIEQMRMQDIADELGIHISTVSRTIKRGRDRLKRSLRYGGRALMSSAED